MIFYSYRGKGGKRGRRELPRPAYEAIVRTLADIGQDLSTMDPDRSLWQAGAGPAGITSGTFYARFRRYLQAAGLTPTGLHVLRHTAAKLRRDAGASVEAVSAFLDHSSLAVTTVYLRRLEGETDRTWPDVAVAIGV
jgi:integrase